MDPGLAPGLAAAVAAVEPGLATGPECLGFVFFDEEAAPEELAAVEPVAAPEELAAVEADGSLGMRAVSPAIISDCFPTSPGDGVRPGEGARFVGGADIFGLATRLAAALFMLAVSPDII